MFSWCSKCQEVSKSVVMQPDTWHLSFGKYLEMRFHGHAYRRRNVGAEIADTMNSNDENLTSCCTHPLHRDHVQYFTYNGIVVSFTYTRISAWEISVPTLLASLKTYRPADQTTYFNELKTFSARGHEIYAWFHDRLAQLLGDVEFPMLNSLKRALNCDQLAFREKVGIVQTLLIEPNVGTIRVDDAMIIMKKTLADNIEIWTQRLSEASIQYRALCAAAAKQESTSPITMLSSNAVTAQHQPEQKQDAQHIDSGTVCTEDLKSSDLESPTNDSSHTNVFYSREVSVDSEHSNTQQKIVLPETPNNLLSNSTIIERDSRPSASSDKKSVKTILRDLLPGDKGVQISPQSPIPSNEHYTLPIGYVPVLVHDQDFSSVIAYCLASSDYKKRIEVSSYCDVHRKSCDSSTDVEDKEATSTTPSNSKENEKDKKSKSSQVYIETNFQTVTTSPTQFTCKVYFARDFDLMRHKLLNVRDGTDEGSFLHRKETNLEATDEKPNKELDRKSSCNSIDSAKCDDRTDDALKSDAENVRTAFIRSLSKSFRWEARGGKSGSKFCKTQGNTTFVYLFIFS